MYKINHFFNYNCMLMGRNGSHRVVTSITSEPVFESSHWQLYLKIYSLLAINKNDKSKKMVDKVPIEYKITFCIKKARRMSLLVTVLTIPSDDPSSNPDEVYGFYLVIIIWREQNYTKTGRSRIILSISGQSYKGSMIVNYNSRVVI